MLGARTTSFRVTDTDINAGGSNAGKRAARVRRVRELVRFEHADASRAPPLGDTARDAIVCTATLGTAGIGATASLAGPQ